MTYQQNLHNLTGYIDWINSSRLLITSDTLGLFGPTLGSEQSPPPNLRIIYPPLDRSCMSCFQKQCEYDDPCMGHILPAQVLRAIDNWWLE